MKLAKSLQKVLKKKPQMKSEVKKKEEEQPSSSPLKKNVRKEKPTGGKKGKKFVDNAGLLQLINNINSQHEHTVSLKQTAEQLKREAMLAHQKRQEEAREARKGKKEKRMSELKEQVRNQRQKLEETEKKVNKKHQPQQHNGKTASHKKEGDSNKKGKRVTFAS